MLRHDGVLKFRTGISDKQKEECFQAMKNMVGNISGLLDMGYGPYQREGGLNHGFIMTFDSTESSNAYLPHPLHEQVKELLVHRLEKVIVFDCVV